MTRILGINSGIEGEGGGSFLQLLESLKSWQILLIAIGIAAVLGVVFGVILGKYQLKKASGHFKPLLTFKQRIVYLSLFALGAAFVLFGVFYDFSAPVADPDSSIVEDGAIDPGAVGGIDSGMIDTTAPPPIETPVLVR